jgi:hypothetical protein
MDKAIIDENMKHACDELELKEGRIRDLRA